MSDLNLMYWQEQLYKTQPRVLKLEFKITGAKTLVPILPPMPALTSCDALTQSQIDEALGSANEFLAADFDATAMGNDAFGGVVNLKGQCAKLLMMKAECYSGTGGATKVERCVQALGLTASTLESACEVSSLGNIGFKVDFGNSPDFDALTSGTVVIELHWVSK